MIFYILLPYILWPITFVILNKFFWVLMPISTGILGVSTLLLYRDMLWMGELGKGILSGLIGATILYIIFFLGDIASKYLGLSVYIDSVYGMIRGSPTTILLSISMVWIGLMEELYWRGGLQKLLDRKGVKQPWIIASILYMLVHIVTFNPILILAALIVGLILSKLVDLYGLYSSITAHIIWLQLIIILFPLR